MSLVQAQMIEMTNSMNRAEVERMEQVDSYARSIQAMEEGESISRGGSSRGGASRGTRSKRKVVNEGSCRPAKRGEGRGGDRGGGSGGRASITRFHDLLTGNSLLKGNVDPNVKREGPNQTIIFFFLKLGAVTVNGLVCKDPKLVQADDFLYKGLNIPGNTSNPNGSKVTLINVFQLPGLNTLGISMARVDYAPWGLNPPHTHPRATEIFTVVEGTIYAGFVTSNPENRLISKVLHKGDVFVFPIGLIHFQHNIGHGRARAISSLSSQNPGIVTIANTVFGSNPSIADDILAKAFQTEKSIIDQIQSKF
ncbi:putative germin-like protein 2-1 [Impatiens glandulifera]|uniref:putative germin-like protein 2-1 n=1 Tax=Impatiens glandulifera TaxID=253017 RepID=UPI001FB0747C|nr:putative germin-like protein 2-1 [Impatiens glandulifera]